MFLFITNKKIFISEKETNFYFFKGVKWLYWKKNGFSGGKNAMNDLNCNNILINSIFFFIYNPGAFHTTASNESWSDWYKSRVSTLLEPHWFSKPDVLGAHLPQADPQDKGCWCGAWSPHSSGKISEPVISLLLMDCHTRSLVLCPSYPYRCGFSLYLSLAVEELFCWS